jgi:hypothetical protein
MTILRRVEMLEAATLKTMEDVGYKIVLLKKGESCKECIIRSGLEDSPHDKIITVTFASPNDKPVM